MSTSSTSKINVAFGGITPFPAPTDPYPRSLGITNLAFDPLFNSWIASSQPFITWPTPQVNSIGAPRVNEESISLPSTSWRE